MTILDIPKGGAGVGGAVTVTPAGGRATCDQAAPGSQSTAFRSAQPVSRGQGHHPPARATGSH
jgi:hypothetical protein